MLATDDIENLITIMEHVRDITVICNISLEPESFNANYIKNFNVENIFNLKTNMEMLDKRRIHANNKNISYGTKHSESDVKHNV